MPLPKTRKTHVLSFLTTIAAASLVVTLFLSRHAGKLDARQNDDAARSFRAPHLQAAASDAPPGPAGWGDGATPRRNLSEAAGAERDQSKDKRPSGVVYEYRMPLPVNATARALLAAAFPRLADPDAAATGAALCAIVKDAEAYLDEWVDYHFGLGFHSIYLVDNSEDHALLRWQDRRRAAGYNVRVMPKPGTHRQMYGYHMCAAEHRHDHAYMAFFDVDEFLVLKKHATVDDLLRQHLPRGALAISQHVFGAGGTVTYAPLPVTKRFVYRDEGTGRDRHPNWNLVKSIVKCSDYGDYPQSPHSIKTNKRTTGSNKAWTDTNGKGAFDSIGSTNNDRPVDIAVIHHYKYLSPKEFHWKSCVRKTVDDKFKDCPNAKNPYRGRVHDDAAWRVLKENVPRYALFDAFEDFM